MPKIPTRSKNKNGKIAKSDAHNLWERLKKHEDAVSRFAHDPNVPFTNNRAEQDLRMVKVKQKVSGCSLELKFMQKLIVAYQVICKQWLTKASTR